MLLKWLDARAATEAGVALADDVYLQSAAAGAGRKDSGARPQGQDLQKFLQKFLPRADQVTRPLKLNFFKRAKLANSFKWRLLEKGIEKELADELTQALVMRLMGVATTLGAAAPSRGPGNKARARDSAALHASAGERLAAGAFAEAREGYQQLVNLDPRDWKARNGLGAALAQLGRYEEAEAELRRAIGIRPAAPEPHYNLAGVLQSTGRFHESELPLRRALKLSPANVDARVSLAGSCVLLGRVSEARGLYEQALRTSPRDTRAIVGLGQIASLEGHFAQAEAAFRRALEIDPHAPYAWAALAFQRRMTPDDADWLKHAEQVAGGGLRAIDEAPLRFAIGKYYDDVGEYPQAFRSFQRANELEKLRAPPYDRAARTRLVDDLIRVYTPEVLAAARAGAEDSARPVLVVGMPRSGTSLVEQIIASHPAAHGAGELDFWPMAAHRYAGELRRGPLPETARRKLAQEYLKVLAGHSAGALRVVDKAPVNADHLGLIHSALPNARIINLRRDPIDTCLSCYFHQFPFSHNFKMDLADLAHHHREHERLVAHWRAILPAGVFLDVPYEELTANQEPWTRRILDFIGLPWDERCLAFERTERAVTTASAWQVRQKMYRSSVERWRHYEKFIGPLRGLSGTGT